MFCLMLKIFLQYKNSYGIIDCLKNLFAQDHPVKVLSIFNDIINTNKHFYFSKSMFVEIEPNKNICINHVYVLPAICVLKGKTKVVSNLSIK